MNSPTLRPTPTPTLADLQNSLQQYLLDENNQLTQQKNIAELTLESEKFSKQQRLDIYHDAYRLRLIDALKNDYPALFLLVGDDTFESITTEYIRLHPSKHPSLRWLGKDVAHFLSIHPEWKDQIYVSELADFEWTQIMVFDSEDSTSATIEDLRSLDNSDWINLRLQLQQGLTIRSYLSNAPQIWNALINSQTETSIDPDVHNEKQDWLIWRKDLQVVYRPIDLIEKASLQAFLQQQTFTEVCADLCHWLPEDQVPLKAVQYLQQWLQNGFISGILVTPQENT